MEQNFLIKFNNQEAYWFTSSADYSKCLLTYDDERRCLKFEHISGVKPHFFDACYAIIDILKDQIEWYRMEYKRKYPFTFKYYKTKNSSSPRQESNLIVFDPSKNKSKLKMSCHYKLDDIDNIFIGDFIELVIHSSYNFKLPKRNINDEETNDPTRRGKLINIVFNSKHFKMKVDFSYREINVYRNSLLEEGICSSDIHLL